MSWISGSHYSQGLYYYASATVGCYIYVSLISYIAKGIKFSILNDSDVKFVIFTLCGSLQVKIFSPPALFLRYNSAAVVLFNLQHQI